MAQVEVRVPDIGDFEGVEVIEVLVSEGDTVAVEDPLVTLESDKATMDVPAEQAGTVGALKVKVGDKVSEGDVLLTLDAGEASEAPDDAGGDEGEVEEPSETEDQDTKSPGTKVPGTEVPGTEGPGTEGSGDDRPSEREPGAAASGGEVYASPSVRKLARQKDIELSTVQGTGPRGRILPEDLDRPRGGGGEAAPGVGSGDAGDLGLAPWPKVDFEKYGEVERIPLSKIRRLAGANLARNWVRIPHVTHDEDADITDLEAFRKQLNAEQSDVKVTMVALMLKAVSATLRAFPDFNASLDGDELVRKKYVHLGFAADTPNGLVVPVIRDAGTKGILALAGELTELSGRARDGKLKPGEMVGATFTISSLGGIGGTSFSPIINAPEVAILGVSRSATKPVWNGSEFVPRLIVPLSLSYDHRVIDGAAAARFCVHLSKVLSDLRRVLL